MIPPLLEFGTRTPDASSEFTWKPVISFSGEAGFYRTADGQGTVSVRYEHHEGANSVVFQIIGFEPLATSDTPREYQLPLIPSSGVAVRSIDANHMLFLNMKA